MAHPRSLLATAVLAVVVAGSSACGGAGPSPRADDSSTSGAATPSNPALNPQTASLAWIGAVQRLFASGTDPQQKAADVTGGDDLVATFEAAHRTLGLTLYAVDVTDPSVSGTTGRGTVELREGSSDGTLLGRTTATFTYDGSTWHLDRSGACRVLAVLGVDCP